MLIKTVFSAGISELPNLNLMGEQFWGFCLLLFSNSSPNPFPLESFSTWIFSLFMHPPSGLKNWQSDLGLLCGDEDALAKGYLLDSYNCSIDWLRSSCRVLTKYRHSETADYNPWVKRPELRQFLTSKASGSWQGGGEWATQEDEMEPMANLVSIVLIFLHILSVFKNLAIFLLSVLSSRLFGFVSILLVCKSLAIYLLVNSLPSLQKIEERPIFYWSQPARAVAILSLNIQYSHFTYRKASNTVISALNIQLLKDTDTHIPFLQ